MKEFARPLIVAAPREYTDFKYSLKRSLLTHFASAVMGFLLSRAVVFNSFLPFGTAFCSGIKKEYSFSALFGIILGSISTVNGVLGGIYIGASIVAIALKWLISLSFDNDSLVSMISCASGTFFSLICALFSQDFSNNTLIRGICEMLLSTGIAYFISIAIGLINSGKRASKMTIEELCSALVGIAVITLSATPYEILGVSISRIISFLIILIASKFGSETMGTVCGVVLGFTMGIAYTDYPMIIGSYALSGLICGIFSKISKYIGIISSIICVAISSLGFFESKAQAIILFEVMISATAFLFLPKKMSNSFAEFFTPEAQMMRVEGLRRNLIMRMKFASDALTDVSETVEEVAEKLAKVNSPSIYDVFINTENEACKVCGLRIHCYETLKDRTYESFLAMTRTIRKTGKIDSRDYPESWVKRCIEPDNVAKSLAKYFDEYENRCNAQLRIMQIRSVVSDQMSGLADMLFDMADELNVSERYDTSASNMIDSSLRKMGLTPSDVCCKINSSGRMTVEICVPSATSINKIRLNNISQKACGRKFNPPIIVNAGAKTLITLTEQAYYNVDIGVMQFCSGGEKMCGDSYSYFTDGLGRTVMLISDGMGSGGRAAVDSAMVSGLMNRLLKAGFGFECSLKLLNSAMMFKSCDESLATVDITAIDLFSGQTDFYKAGSPETIVIKGKHTGRAKCTAFPAGIVREVSFDKTTSMLDDGDVVVMLSDGVCDVEGDWIEKTVKNCKGQSAQAMAENIAEMAQRRRNDGHDDDITVMVGIVNKANKR